MTDYTTAGRPETTGTIAEAFAQPLIQINEGKGAIVAPAGRQATTESLFPDIIWKDDTTGFISCPGADTHTGKNGPRDCQVKIDGVPTVYCVHASCEEEIKEANRALRTAIESSAPVESVARVVEQPLSLRGVERRIRGLAYCLLGTCVTTMANSAEEEPFLDRIIIYPIKSLDGVSVREARMTQGGILEFDRIHAIVDEAGVYVNAKRNARVQLLRTEFSPDFQEVLIGETGQAARQRFCLRQAGPFNAWLSDFFGFTVSLVSEMVSGFPDDKAAFGPTVTSSASLREIAGWFDDLSIDNFRRRFRSNLELEAKAPFWEDRLFGKPNELRSFQIGEVNLLGHNPCQRCVVPTRDPDCTEPILNFQKTFMGHRKKTLPPWAEVERFNHYYRFAINTSVPASEMGKLLRVGDPIRILS